MFIIFVLALSQLSGPDYLGAWNRLVLEGLCDGNRDHFVNITAIPGGGTEQNFIVGRLRPEIQPLTFLYTIFDREGLPSVYLFLVHSQTAMTDFLVLS